VGQLGQHRLDLAGVAEGPLRLAHDDPRPSPARVGQLLEDGGRFFSLRPRQRAGRVFVVGHGDDLGSPGDERPGRLELPAQALLGVLLVGRRGPGVGEQPR
jgi:hypothetical protein